MRGRYDIQKEEKLFYFYLVNQALKIMKKRKRNNAAVMIIGISARLSPNPIPQFVLSMIFIMIKGYIPRVGTAYIKYKI